MVRWWWYGKLAVLDLAETGRQIGEKLFALLSADQQRELAQFILEETTSRVNINDMPYQAIFRGKYSIPQKSNHPLTEARAGDLYFCLEHRLVTIREQPIELTIKEFEIFSLLILNPKRVFTYEMLMDLVWEEDYTYYFRKAVNNHISNLRKKLKVAPDLPEYIKSVYGIGYKFEEKKKGEAVYKRCLTLFYH